jgi:Uma2 family endonuclease
MAAKTTLVTYDDYQNLPDDGKRYEIIGGELFMTPAPSTLHQRILRKLLVKLDIYIEEHGLGEVFSAPTDVILSMTDVVEPDLLFISKKQLKIITKKNIVETPNLVMEILSKNTAAVDRNQKKALYERYGVKEYWIVNPEEKQIEQYVLQDESFALNAQLGASEKLTSKVIEGFSLYLPDVFAS